MFSGGVVSPVVGGAFGGGVFGSVLWWAALFCGGRHSTPWLLGGRPVLWLTHSRAHLSKFLLCFSNIV